MCMCVKELSLFKEMVVLYFVLFPSWCHGWIGVVGMTLITD